MDRLPPALRACVCRACSERAPRRAAVAPDDGALQARLSRGSSGAGGPAGAPRGGLRRAARRPTSTARARTSGSTATCATWRSRSRSAPRRRSGRRGVACSTRAARAAGRLRSCRRLSAPRGPSGPRGIAREAVDFGRTRGAAVSSHPCSAAAAALRRSSGAHSAIKQKAAELGVSLRRPKERQTDFRPLAGPVVLRRIRELTEAELCPSCGKRLIGVRRTGLCGRCHFEGLVSVHEEEIARLEGQRELWAARSKLRRRRRSLRRRAGRRATGKRTTRQSIDMPATRRSDESKQRQSVAASATVGRPEF